MCLCVTGSIHSSLGPGGGAECVKTLLASVSGVRLWEWVSDPPNLAGHTHKSIKLAQDFLFGGVAQRRPSPFHQLARVSAACPTTSQRAQTPPNPGPGGLQAWRGAGGKAYEGSPCPVPCA